MTIPTTIAALLPLFATILSSWLNDDGFKPGVNALIAFFALLLTAIVCLLLSSSIPLTWPLRVVAVLGYIGVLMNGDLSVLYGYLVGKSSPVSKALGLHTPVVESTLASSPIPLRASALATPPAQPTPDKPA